MKKALGVSIKLIVLALGGIIIIGLFGSLIGSWKKKDIVKEREVVLVKLEQEQKELEKQLAEAQGVAFVEREARDKLGLVKPGETVVLLGETYTYKPEKQEEFVANWKQWWRLFF